MENFTDKDVKDFADKLFEAANKATAGHMVEPENIDKENKLIKMKPENRFFLALGIGALLGLIIPLTVLILFYYL